MLFSSTNYLGACISSVCRPLSRLRLLPMPAKMFWNQHWEQVPLHRGILRLLLVIHGFPWHHYHRLSQATALPKLQKALFTVYPSFRRIKLLHNHPRDCLMSRRMASHLSQLKAQRICSSIRSQTLCRFSKPGYRAT